MSRKVNLYATQGETFSYLIKVTDADSEPFVFTGNISANATIRKSYLSVNSVPFSVSTNTGLVTLGLTSDQTSLLMPGRYIYDVKLTDSSNVVTKPIAGIMTIAPGSTR
jgi:hypothetical protein